MGSSEALLLVGHGSIASLEELPAFLKQIRRGRPAPDELLQEMRHRYDHIGLSPLLPITKRLANAVQALVGVPTVVAMRFGAPTVDEALRFVVDVAPGARLAVVPLAPFSVHVYGAVVAEALEPLSREFGEAAPKLRVAEPWGEEPAWIDGWVAAIQRTLGAIPDGRAATAPVLLTAHSLPLRVLAGGDPYEAQVRSCAAAVEARLGRPVRLAFQSQGGPELGAWLGPTLTEALDELVAGAATDVVLAPIGFLTDHVETLYDLDVEARALARERGLELHRVPALNDDPPQVRALANVALRTLGR